MDVLIGNGITSTKEFRDANGTLTNPTAVTMTVREPDGTTTTYTYGSDDEVTRDSTGVYSFSIVFDQEGRHGLRWLGTGTVPAADEDFVNILPSQVI